MLDGFLIHIVTFVLPLMLANLSHMVCIKLDLFPKLARPIAVRYFGESKTYRGFILLILFTAFYCVSLVYLFSFSFDSFAVVVGAVLGFGYTLGELPNSFVKRRLNIESGRHGKWKWLQLIVDKIDILIILISVHYVILYISFIQAVFLFLLSFAIHVILSFTVWKLGLNRIGDEQARIAHHTKLVKLLQANNFSAGCRICVYGRGAVVCHILLHQLDNRYSGSFYCPSVQYANRIRC
jgi:hypothetical protein